MKLRNLMFVVPNLFTVSSIFCGFYAMTLCAVDGTPTHLYQSSLAIFFGIFFDGFDGRVARLTRTQSLFGQELDSLADVVTFGAAPALLVWKWALQPLGLVGVLGAFLFAACGALRLARFNVLALRSPGGGGARFFIGMPIPFAAAGIVSLIIAFQNTKGGELPADYRWPVLVGVAMLALLMVSTVRYRTFKEVRPSPVTGAVLASVLALGVLVATRIHPAWVLFAYFALYMVSGLVESTVMLRRHLVARRTQAVAGATAGSLADVVDEDEDEDDDADGTNNVDEQEYL
jgi:CDP-diacylglycerol--serine O-phosphatidyltransferase